jgi:hypothetical protein
MKKTSCYVIAAAYSGTTLFNSLMDTQPRVRGIGEAVRHIHRGPRSQHPWCASCNKPVDDCNKKPQIQGNNIHRAFFEHYPDTDVLVDISKSWVNCFRWQHTDEEIKVISMCKWPHAFAWSQLNHFRRRGEDRTTDECFEAWVKAYDSALKMYDIHSSWSIRRRLALGKPHCYPILLPDNIYSITYHDLVNNTAETVAGVCEFLGVEFDEAALADWWQRTDTCTVGGNQAVYAQKNNPTFFQEGNSEAGYLNGKYLGKHGKIFFDKSWLKDEQFLSEAHEAYANHRKKIRQLAGLFGLDHYRTCLHALRNPCASISAEPGTEK